MEADHSRSSPASGGLSRSSSFALDYWKGWKNCWGRFMCFAPRRRVKYHRTDMSLGPQSFPAEIGAANGSLTLDTPYQVTLLPPVMGAPPPSPVSFGATLESASSQLSPANLLSLLPEKAESVDNYQGFHLGFSKTDAHMGSFVLDDAPVTPPLHSTLTTATATPLSTAPFTPPPELAHLTTPSSPEVPLGQSLEASFAEFRSSLSEKVEHLSLQNFPSAHFQLTHRLHPCSPVGQLVTYNSGASSPETSSSMPERVFSEKGLTCLNGVNSCFLSALDDASHEGSRMATLEIVCEVPTNPAECSQRAHPVSNRVEDAFEKYVKRSSQYAHNSCSDSFKYKRQDNVECCSRCGELSAKCRDLSEALEQTKRKLTLVESKFKSIDERERRFKQLIQWMQLSAKLRQENIFQLSEELSWQGGGFLDLQECHLVEAGIRLPNGGKDDT